MTQCLCKFGYNVLDALVLVCAKVVVVALAGSQDGVAIPRVVLVAEVVENVNSVQDKEGIMMYNTNS